MHVTLVSPFDPVPGGPTDSRRAHVGGVERVFAEVSRRLARRGHGVTIVCTTDGAAGTAYEDDIRIVRVRRRFTLMRTPVARLSRHLTRETDLVQVAATYPFTTPHVIRRARQLGIPSVLDFHFEPAPGTALGRAASLLYGRVGPRAYPLADAVLVRSLAYARASPSLARVPRARWRVVPNGIDTARFRPGTHGGHGDYILFVGRLVAYKGLPVLLDALARLGPTLPLLVAGDGPMRGRLEILARSLRLDARFLGHVPDADLPDLYRGARVTVLPSVTAQEAFGLALLESMACGTPVVASDLPGVAELASVGGLVARRGDPQTLADRLRRAIDPGTLPRGANLAQRVHRVYGWDAVTDQLVDIYREVLDGRGSRSGHAEVRGVADPSGHPVL